MVAAIGVLAAALALNGGRLGPHLLLTGVFLAGLAVGALFFMALQVAVGAKWADSLWPLASALTTLLPLALALLLTLLWLRPETYPWWLSEQPGLRKVWLTRDFFALRTVGYVALWSWAAWLFWRRRPTQGTAAAVLVVLALTVWLAASDWLMSLTPDWSSTVFGVYVFTGCVTSALAAILLGSLGLRARQQPGLALVGTHQQDLATLLFAMSCVWMYLWYSQYMLVWYTNQPHEASYYLVRTSASWRLVFWGTAALKGVVPFALLLSRRGKRNAVVLTLVAASVLAGQWFELYGLIFPIQQPEVLGAGLLGGMALATVTTVLAMTVMWSFEHSRRRTQCGCGARDSSEPGPR